MMMRMWREEYMRPVRRGPSTAMSIGVHGVLILGAVMATSAPPALKSLWDLANRIYYLPPPVRMMSTDGSASQVRFVEKAPDGSGSGFAQAKVPTGGPLTTLPTSQTPGDRGMKVIANAEAPVTQGSDSVFSIIDVDSAARTDPMSAAPTYPEALQKAGIEGMVSVRYVVDSTGLADPASLVILHSTRDEFAVAVREALPYMHFVPARIGAKRVRQFVEQNFNFKIQKLVVDSLAPKKKPPTA